MAHAKTSSSDDLAKDEPDLRGRSTQAPPDPHRLCQFCGHANPDGARFCNSCGAPVNLKVNLRPCPQCEAPNNMMATHCQKCGAALDERGPSPVNPAHTAVASVADSDLFVWNLGDGSEAPAPAREDATKPAPPEVLDTPDPHTLTRSLTRSEPAELVEAYRAAPVPANIVPTRPSPTRGSRRLAWAALLVVLASLGTYLADRSTAPIAPEAVNAEAKVSTSPTPPPSDRVVRGTVTETRGPTAPEPAAPVPSRTVETAPAPGPRLPPSASETPPTPQGRRPENPPASAAVAAVVPPAAQRPGGPAGAPPAVAPRPAAKEPSAKPAVAKATPRPSPDTTRAASPPPPGDAARVRQEATRVPCSDGMAALGLCTPASRP